MLSLTLIWILSPTPTLIIILSWPTPLFGTDTNPNLKVTLNLTLFQSVAKPRWNQTSLLPRLIAKFQFLNLIPRFQKSFYKVPPVPGGLVSHKKWLWKIWNLILAVESVRTDHVIENLQRKLRIADDIRIIYEKKNLKKILLPRKCVLKFQGESLRLFLATTLNFAVIAINETFDKPWSRLRATVNKN